jgi:hypothetical protein
VYDITLHFPSYTIQLILEVAYEQDFRRRLRVFFIEMPNLVKITRDEYPDDWTFDRISVVNGAL